MDKQYCTQQVSTSVNVYVFLVTQVICIYIYIWSFIVDNSKPATKPAKDIHLHHNEDRYCTTCLSGRRSQLGHCTKHHKVSCLPHYIRPNTAGLIQKLCKNLRCSGLLNCCYCSSSSFVVALRGLGNRALPLLMTFSFLVSRSHAFFQERSTLLHVYSRLFGLFPGFGHPVALSTVTASQCDHSQLYQKPHFIGDIYNFPSVLSTHFSILYIKDTLLP